MQNYTVLVGVNGAGLMNALYLPYYATAIQLVPYQAQVNFVEFGKFLQARGNYLEWHNSNPDNHVQSVQDVNNNNANTIVDVDELKALVATGLKMAEDTWQNSHRVEL